MKTAQAQAPLSLLNVSYDPTRELYAEFNQAFAKHWKAKTGQDVSFKQSHGGSANKPAPSSTVWTPMWPRWRWLVTPTLCTKTAT